LNFVSSSGIVSKIVAALSGNFSTKRQKWDFNKPITQKTNNQHQQKYNWNNDQIIVDCIGAKKLPKPAYNVDREQVREIDRIRCIP
jgi:flagellar hook assembly protein FlgD